MLKDGLGKVLFIGPRHVTQWVGHAAIYSPAMKAGLANQGYRMATEEDLPVLSDEVLKKLKRSRVDTPVVLPPIEVTPQVVDLAEVADPIEEEEVAPVAKKRGRPRKTNTTDNAD